MKRIDDLNIFEMRHAGARIFGIAGVLMMAACGGGGSSTPQDFVDELPDEIIPIVIENEDEIREIIEQEVPDDLRDEANDIVDLIVAVTTTTVSATSITATTATD